MNVLIEFQKQMLKLHGWYCHIVPSGGCVDFHTHGVQESWGHPDFQFYLAEAEFYQLGEEMLNFLISGLIERIKAGETFVAGMRVNDVLLHVPPLLVEAPEGPRTVLRIILPDVRGQVERDKMTDALVRQYTGIP